MMELVRTVALAVVLATVSSTPVAPGMKSIGVAIKEATLNKGEEKTVSFGTCHVCTLRVDATSAQLEVATLL